MVEKKKELDSMCRCGNKDLYVADYTNSDDSRAEELYFDEMPTDVEFFHLKNPEKIVLKGAALNNDFCTLNNEVIKHCEAYITPKILDKETNKKWSLFVELKYTDSDRHIGKRLEKAKEQLISTVGFFRKIEVLNEIDVCYCVASLPLRNIPFGRNRLSPEDIFEIKKKYNIIYREANSGVIVNNDKISFTNDT